MELLFLQSAVNGSLHRSKPMSELSKTTIRTCTSNYSCLVPRDYHRDL